MSVGQIVARWIARHLLAFVLILLLLIAGRYLLVPGWNWARAEISQSQSIAESEEAFADAESRLREYASERQVEAQARIQSLPNAADAQLRSRLNQIQAERETFRSDLLSGPAMAIAAASGQSDRLFEHFRARVEIGLLDREEEAIRAVLQARFGQSRRVALEERRRSAVERYREARGRWQQAQAQVERLEARPMADARNALCRTVRPAVGCDNYRALQQARRARDSARSEAGRAVAEVRAVDRARSSLAAASAATRDASAIISQQTDALAQERRRLARRADDNFVNWARGPIVEMLPTALLILAVAIAGPALIKAFFYFVVAPFASRQPPIRLVATDRGSVISDQFRSSVSQRIALGRDEELLVMPEAIQSSPNAGKKTTQWLLNSRFPITSLASGLVALVRFRGEGVVEVTATGDPLSELALVSLPEGSAMVVKPRSLRGVIQPMSTPIRATRHWRFGLSAWLTLRFRHLVFHGPCTLILQGSRGLRLEPAAAGRSINRAASVAYSAALGLSVRRSEAFAPYLMGRQDLLNHSFSGPSGHIVFEERPRAGEASGLWGRGLAGLADAALKPFGL